MKFLLTSLFKPTGDQPQAMDKLYRGWEKNFKDQVLLGVTGSGKTFTLANVIAKVNKPTLVISHNKTLAGQLYQEFRDFFPQNAVSYFVSYYDYYQPEAYLPASDTYIAKETQINQEIDRLRLQTTTNLLTRKDVIVVASVSCIYNIGSPKEYGNYMIKLKKGQTMEFKNLANNLIDLQYHRDDYDFGRGTFRIRGGNFFVWPAYEQNAIKIELEKEVIAKITWINPVNGLVLEEIDGVCIFPAKHFMVNPNIFKSAFEQIRKDLKIQLEKLEEAGKILAAHRLSQKVNYDLEMIQELGYVNGIENYSRYFDQRLPGQPPYTLLDYFPKDYLLIIDESHMTMPQLKGMFRGDQSRKKTLVDYGFRLPSCFDNRPLTLEEFRRRQNQTIYTSATPSSWELEQSQQVVQQLVRPTGILDPLVSIKPTKGQIPNLIKEIIKRKKLGERVLVTTLTKRLAEALSGYLKSLKAPNQINVNYLHSQILTLDRQDLLDDLREGKYDVLVGINLLREGLDLPEVSLVAILDADKEGFLRSKTSLIQTMGRAARNINSQIILYADKETDSIKAAIKEVERRRLYQLNWNKKYGLTPVTISKPIREKLIKRAAPEPVKDILKFDLDQLTPMDRKNHIKKIRGLMIEAAQNLDFAKAARIRDFLKKNA